MTTRIKTLEREKAHLTERLELTNRDQVSEASTLTKRYEKEKELNERLAEELEGVKAERDRKVVEFQTKLDRERERTSMLANVTSRIEQQGLRVSKLS